MEKVKGTSIWSDELMKQLARKLSEGSDGKGSGLNQTGEGEKDESRKKETSVTG